MAKSKYVTFEDLVRFHREVIAPDLDRRFAASDERMEARFAASDERMERMEARFAASDERMERMEAGFTRFIREFMLLHDKIDNGLESVRIDMAKNKLDVLDRFDSLYKRLETISIENHMLDAAVRRLEGKRS